MTARYPPELDEQGGARQLHRGPTNADSIGPSSRYRTWPTTFQSPVDLGRVVY